MDRPKVMDANDEWILKHDCLTVNGAKYWFRCLWTFDKKAPNDDRPAMQLVFNVYKDGVGWIDWKDYKGTYFAEKFKDYVQNTLNGQRAVYYDINKERSFE